MASPSPSRMVGSLQRSMPCYARSLLSSQQRLHPSCAVRPFATVATKVASSSSLSSPMFPERTKRKDKSNSDQKSGSGARTRRWNGSKNTTDRANITQRVKSIVSVRLESEELDLITAYAIIQELQRVFGKIREFAIKRDEFDPSRLLGRMVVEFESDESVQKLIRSGQSLYPVRVPSRTPILRNPAVDGGVGLEDITDLLRPIPVGIDGYEAPPAKRTTETEGSTVSTGAIPDKSTSDNHIKDDPDNRATGSSSNTDDSRRTIFVQIAMGSHLSTWQGALRSHSDEVKLSRTERKYASRAFLQWGGFYPHLPETVSETEEKPVDRSETADVVKEAKEAMDAALHTARSRLFKLGELEYAPHNQNSKEAPDDTNEADVALGESVNSSPEADTSDLQPPQSEMDLAEDVTNESMRVPVQDGEAMQDSNVSLEGGSSTQTTISNEERDTSHPPPQEGSSSTSAQSESPRQSTQSKPNDLRSKLLNWWKLG